MASVLFRTGSGTFNSSIIPGSTRFSGPIRQGSFSGCEKLEFSPLVNNNRRKISRAISEPQAIIKLRSNSDGSQTFPDILSEVEELQDEDIAGCSGSLKFAEKCFDRMNWFPASRIEVEEPKFTGVGSGSGRDRDGFGSGWSSGGNSNNNNDRSKIGAYYQKLLTTNSNDPLLLRNYSEFLHEEGDTVKAEEYYGRAILANPGDGELLSLYGKLIWETQRDAERSKSYFDHAIVAAPDDCMVLGSYAQFMWEAEEDEDDDEDEEFGSKVLDPTSQPLVVAF